MENKIILKFDKSLSRLAGNSYGQEIYDDQVKNKVNFNKMNVICIPEHIEDIAISFVQGFTQDIFEEISKNEFSKYFKIEGNQKVIDKFSKSVYF